MNLLHRALCAPLLLIAYAVAPSAQAADATGGLKLLRYGPLGHEKPGMLDADGNIRDLSGVVRDLTPAELTSESLAKLRALDAKKLPQVPAGTRLGTPLSGTRKIIAIGLNYAAHAAEGGVKPPPEPILFQKAISSLSGPNDPVIRPKNSTALDYEAELVIVIGKRASYVSEADAGQYIAGYAVGNDVSERDFQAKRSGQWTKGKSADTFAPFGPYLVTADGVKQNELGIWLKVNDKQRQKANTKDMIFKPHFLVSYISQFMSLEPGDLIYTGTPEGVAAVMTPPGYLQPGDVVTLGIDGLGEQKQQVVAYEQQSKAMTADEEQVNALEQRRLAAIGAGDVAALRELLTDDYIHVHQVARVDDRETYLKAIQKTPRRTERGPLTIRVYGDMAVLTGEQRNTLVTPIPGIGPLQPTMCTEVAVRQNGKWRFVSTQTTPVMQPGDPAPTLPPPEDVTKEKQGPLTARQQEVVALESRRAAAIAKNDFAALTKVLSDDYIHVYGSGKVGDRASYIEQLKSAPRSYTRGPLTVRLYGDSAVVSGWLINSIRFPNKPEMTYQVMVTQVAHRVNGNWQFVSQHMTPKRDIPKG